MISLSEYSVKSILRLSYVQIRPTRPAQVPSSSSLVPRPLPPQKKGPSIHCSRMCEISATMYETGSVSVYVNCLSDMARSSAETCSLMILVTSITLESDIKSKPGSSSLQMHSEFSCFSLLKCCVLQILNCILENYVLSAHRLSGLPMGG